MLSLFPKSFPPVMIPEATSLTQVIFLDEQSLDMVFSLVHEHTKLRLFCCVFGSSHEVIHHLRILLSASHTSADVFIWSIALDGASVSVDGHLELGKNIHHVHGSLHQSHIVFGDSSQRVSLAPALYVSSHDVQASHGAQIEPLDDQHLFYMMAKGLSLELAQHLVIHSLLLYVLDQLPDMDVETKEATCSQIITRYFNFS